MNQILFFSFHGKKCCVWCLKIDWEFYFYSSFLFSLSLEVHKSYDFYVFRKQVR